LWSQGFQKLEAREEGGGLTGYTYDENAAETKEATHEISCQFVVGCDGKTSDLRKNYFHRDNIETYEWKEYKGVMLHMMCECQLQWPLPRKSYRLEQKSLNGFGPTIGGGAAEPVPSLDKTLFRLSVNAPFTMWGSNIDCLEAPPLSLLQKQLKPKLPKGSKLLTPSWSKYYRMNHFISSSFSYGGAFLVGEAAHAHPPVGILPMNSVIEDTANLAWKLTLAIKLGVTDPECTLLQSYDSERRPQAEKVSGLSNLSLSLSLELESNSYDFQHARH
jgi:2-polyprenyl-6-methoxyphenol hydroxylase-like FAD-dependent oxidoreductase